MKSPRDATRRNRNIGTARSGRGQNNRLVIPTRWHPKWTPYYENLRNHRTVSRDIDGTPITFLVEKTRSGCYHACTIDDITHVMRFVPRSDLKGIELIVLRQPKRKEEVLHGAWGRWAPYVEIDDHKGSAIFLDAADTGRPLRWEKSLGPDRQKELERLQKDGHSVTITKRHHVLLRSLDSVRSTQLYRTLLHEIGHHVDYTQGPGGFWRKPSSERERFAHRYADELRARLEKNGVIPFRRMLSARRLEADDLRISAFEAI
jgi:hypothetical protein